MNKMYLTIVVRSTRNRHSTDVIHSTFDVAKSRECKKALRSKFMSSHGKKKKKVRFTVTY